MLNSASLLTQSLTSIQTLDKNNGQDSSTAVIIFCKSEKAFSRLLQTLSVQTVRPAAIVLVLSSNENLKKGCMQESITCKDNSVWTFSLYLCSYENLANTIESVGSSFITFMHETTSLSQFRLEHDISLLQMYDSDAIISLPLIARGTDEYPIIPTFQKVFPYFSEVLDQASGEVDESSMYFDFSRIKTQQFTNLLIECTTFNRSRFLASANEKNPLILSMVLNIIAASRKVFLSDKCLTFVSLQAEFCDA